MPSTLAGRTSRASHQQILPAGGNAACSLSAMLIAIAASRSSESHRPRGSGRRLGLDCLWVGIAACRSSCAPLHRLPALWRPPTHGTVFYGRPSCGG